MQHHEADRLLKLPPYVFARLNKLKAEERKKGIDLIDLGMGNPNILPPKEVIQAITDALKDPENSRYPDFDGLLDFRAAICNWVKNQYGLKIDPEHEVTPLIGSKEGLIHFAFAFINPGDTALVPSPAYPAHFNGTLLAGGTPIILPTSQSGGYIPNLKDIDPEVAKKAKILILSYPTNPTAATAPKEFFEEAVKFAKEHDLILVHDFAYAEIYFEGKKPPSCLSIPGAKDVTIEFHSMSKTFGMAGYRCGFAIGNQYLIETLKRIKTNLDYGLFAAVQIASTIALTKTDKSYLEEMRATYQSRRDVLLAGLRDLGWKVEKPLGSMYIWAPIPKGFNSMDFSLDLMKKTGVVVAPGTAFGELGEGYVRISLIANEARLEEAISRMKKAEIHYE